MGFASTDATFVFSKHGRQRLKQRTSLTPDDALQLIHNKQAVLLGKERGLHRSHWLIHSKRDNDEFVIVQDYLNGSIVTVWTVEYHDNLAWTITDEQREEARKLVIEAPTIETPVIKTSTNIYVKALYRDPEGRQKFTKLIKFDGRKYDMLLAPATKCIEVKEQVRQKVKEKGFPEKGCVTGLLFSVGYDGTPCVIDYADY
jgi:hypothetical protein